jgi:hypothetical protein
MRPHSIRDDRRDNAERLDCIGCHLKRGPLHIEALGCPTLEELLI